MLKNKLFVLLLFLIIICGMGYVNAEKSSLPLLGKVIYLDPGHPGTCLA